MSDKSSHPLVQPGEYEHNKDTIANYRAYLDMYERMNEQGLKNHEEVERLEKALRDKIRAGEEAKRALDMLQSTRTAPRLTDGRSQPLDMVPLVPVAPLVIPTAQSSSNSAYIEEVSPNQEPAKSSPVTPAVYTPYATNRSSLSQTQSVPQPSYYSTQQQQFNRNFTPHAGAQRNPHMERNGSTITTSSAPQSQQPSTQYNNSTQHTSYYRPTTYQPSPYVTHPLQAQPSSSAQTRQSFSHSPTQQAQAEYQRYLDIVRQEQLRLAALGYQSSHSTSYQGQYNRPPPNQVQPSNQQSKVNISQAQSGGQPQLDVSRQATGGFRAPGQMHSGRDPMGAQKQAVPTQPAPRPDAVQRVGVVNQARTSSLDGALGPSAVAQSSGPVASGSGSAATPVAQPTVTPSAPETITIAPAEKSQLSTSQPQVPSAVPISNGATSQTTTPVTASGRSKHSPIIVPHSTPSPPLRTPSQADKKHLARDLLRALKRPRLENSPPSPFEPEPKRHAPESVVKGVPKPTSVALSTQTSSATTSNPVTPSALPTQPWQAQQAVYRPPAPVIQSIRPRTDVSSAVQPLTTTINHNAPFKWNSISTPTSVQQNQSLVTKFRYQPNTTTAVPYGLALESAQQSHFAGVPDGHSSVTQGLTVKATSPDAVGASASTTLVVPIASPAPPSVITPTIVTAAAAAGATKPIVDSVGSSAKDTSQATASPSTPRLSSNITSQAAASSSTSGLSSNITSQATASSSTSGPSPNVTNQATASSSTPATVVTSVAKHPEPSRVDEPNVVMSRKMPLFLPSPTSSHTSEHITPLESISQLSIGTGNKGKGKGKRRVSPSLSQTTEKPSSNLVFAHVLAPPLPAYVKRWKAQQQNLGRRGGFDAAESDLPPESRSLSPSLSQFRVGSSSRSPSVPAVPVGVIDLVEDEGEGGAMEEPSAIDMGFSSYDPAERDVLHEYCTRLRESFCRWQDCDVVLNTPGALLQHMDIVHRPRKTSIESPWTCQWAGCGYTVISVEEFRQHIQKHAIFPLWCPYTDCTESFRTPRQLIRHKRNDHNSGAVLRSTAQPKALSGQPSKLIPHIPKILPSYMTEYRVVRPASISQSRHEIIMPAVRRRISGNVPAQLQGYNAARPMPATPSGTLTAPSVNTPYSFLEHRSTRYSSYLSSPAKSKIGSDLDSGYVTSLVEKGLVLWPDKESGEAVSEAMIRELDGVKEGEGELEGEGRDVFGPTIATTSSGDGAMIRDPSDEEAVELMLMQVPTE